MGRGVVSRRPHQVTSENPGENPDFRVHHLWMGFGRHWTINHWKPVGKADDKAGTVNRGDFDTRADIDSFFTYLEKNGNREFRFWQLSDRYRKYVESKGLLFLQLINMFVEFLVTIYYII